MCSEQNPTTSKRKNVASGDETSRTLRGFLAATLHSLRREQRLPPIKGDLSSWIFQMHGFEKDPETQEYRPGKSDPALMPSLTAWMGQMTGPRLDPKKVKGATLKASEFQDGRRTEELTKLYRKNLKEFESQFNRLALGVLDAYEVPAGLPTRSNLSTFEDALKILRASHALEVCLAVHEIHPVTLIVRASRGDRRAVLDLVKVDKLFLHDPCTEKVIREAELRNDRPFLEQLARAQTYRPKLRAREVHRLYFYLLFMLESQGMQLPTEHELWRVVDPHGREYESLGAFERDFQRRKEAFAKMMNDANP